MTQTSCSNDRSYARGGRPPQVSFGVQLPSCRPNRQGRPSRYGRRAQIWFVTLCLPDCTVNESPLGRQLPEAIGLPPKAASPRLARRSRQFWSPLARLMRFKEATSSIPHPSSPKSEKLLQKLLAKRPARHGRDRLQVVQQDAAVEQSLLVAAFHCSRKSSLRACKESFGRLGRVEHALLPASNPHAPRYEPLATLHGVGDSSCLRLVACSDRSCCATTGHCSWARSRAKDSRAKSSRQRIPRP